MSRLRIGILLAGATLLPGYGDHVTTTAPNADEHVDTVLLVVKPRCR